MKSKWSDDDAKALTNELQATDPTVNEDVALRVYTSRLIGRDATLVLHGGGNTSVKTTRVDDTGTEVAVLCVKGSGWDLGDIAPAGLPAVRLESLGALLERESLSDEDMVNAQRTRLLDASSPNPSVETLLHAFLPHKFIDHSHADAILALVDQPNSEELCRELYGDTLAIVPYVMPGFDLAKLAATVQRDNPDAEGLLLMRHGLFTYGQSAKESYERHIAMVDKAERFIADKKKETVVARREVAAVDYARLAPILRGRLGSGQRRYVLHLRTSDEILAYVAREDLGAISQRGVPTPDHVIRTKRVPLLLEITPDMDDAAIAEHVDDRVAEYRAAYQRYVADASKVRGRQITPLDPDPRVILVPGLGIITAGANMNAAAVAADLHEHCAWIIEAAEAVGTYTVLDLEEIFDMEYWSLEQAKLGKKKALPLTAKVAFITGAASGIGAASARRFAKEGAHLFLVDRDAEGLATVAGELGAASAVVDLTDKAAVASSMRACVECFGGVDIVISNAGLAPQGAMHEVSDETLAKSFEVNFFAHQRVAQAATRIMRAQGRGGCLLFNASKAAFNPGKDFGPYAIPKAAVVALMKQYALENGAVGIRSNAINADRVRTGLLPPDFVAERAAARGLSADAYFQSNLLAQEVTGEDVAQAFYDLARARSTTGCVVTVDGGNIAASPR